MWISMQRRFVWHSIRFVRSFVYIKWQNAAKVKYYWVQQTHETGAARLMWLMNTTKLKWLSFDACGKRHEWDMLRRAGWGGGHTLARSMMNQVFLLQAAHHHPPSFTISTIVRVPQTPIPATPRASSPNWKCVPMSCGIAHWIGLAYTWHSSA